MKQGLKRMLMMGMLALPVAAMASYPGDSVGVKVVNGKPMVMYKIAKGDNLGRISKEYGVTVAQVEEINGISGGAIQVGQIVLVPSRNPQAGSPTKNTASTTPTPAAGGDRKQHTVQKGETLYAVSRKYSVSVDQIKQWNQLSVDGLKEGQKLWVSGTGSTAAKQDGDVMEIKLATKPAEVSTKPVDNPVKPAETPVKPAEVTPKPAETVVSNTKVADPAPNGGDDQPKIKSGGGVHVVRPGETLFGIARTYGMDVSELRKINRLEDATIKEGQALRVKADSPENPNQGTSLADALSQAQDTTPKLDAFPDLRVLTAPTTTTVPSTAVVTVYKDKSSGKNYKRVEETGAVGKIEDFSTDQTRFYAFHRHLPVGSYIRVDYPAKGQSILVEVINRLPEKDPYAVRLSAKCMEYLMIREAGAEVRLRYVVPFAE